MGGDNASGADNQQERPDVSAWWVVGFVDGEGCFSVGIVRNRTCRLGWQVQPEFSVSQGARSLTALHELQQFFACGTVIRNARHDNHREAMYRFSVRRGSDLRTRIVPFFEAHPMRTAKRDEFRRFVRVLQLMEAGGHLDPEGLADIARIAETMNHRKPARYPESSEATRRPPCFDEQGEDMVRAAWRHAGNSSEIPCRVSSDLHEWRNDFPTVSTTDPAKLKYE